MLHLDVPFIGAGGDVLNSSSLGYSIRSHAIIKQKFVADFNFSRSFWNITSNIQQKPTQLEFGGAMLLKNNIRSKNIKVVLDRKETSRERYNDKIKTTEQITYINVPGSQLKFSGVRGGVYIFQSIFDYVMRDQQPNTPFFVNYNVTGYSRAYGVYGGITWGSVTNLHVKLKDGRVRNEMLYNRWYFDVVIAPQMHTYIKTTPNNLTRNASPIGCRIGFDNTNRTENGILGKIVNAEVGYRPGLNGIYAAVGISFIQIRQHVSAF
jgi:hypothetical protein